MTETVIGLPSLVLLRENILLMLPPDPIATIGFLLLILSLISSFISSQAD